MKRFALFTLAFVCVGALAGAANTEKQSVFLLCPHHKHFSSWSLYLEVDKADPSKPLALGLEELTGKNSEDLAPDGYQKVLQAQDDPATPRRTLGTLNAAEFGRGEIRVEKDDALHVSVSPAGPNMLRLSVSIRVSADKRFNIGGKDQGERDIVIKYDAGTKRWEPCAQRLVNESGQDAAGGACRPLSGLVFPVKSTGIYRIVAVMRDGDAVIVQDK